MVSAVIQFSLSYPNLNTSADNDNYYVPVFYFFRLHSIERESNDTTGKRTEESSQKIIEFQKKLDLARDQVSNLAYLTYFRCKSYAYVI